jgi:2-polyprenyl-3-methyl-5-hydroxy-6-metoxy-1,4-benzoquinol methylase
MAKLLTREQIEQQKAEFYKKHPEPEWEEFKHDPKSFNNLAATVCFLINTQNGQDVDDYVLDPGSSCVRYLTNKLEGKDVLFVGTGTGREMQFAKEEGANTVCGITIGKRNQSFAEEMVGHSPQILDMHTTPWEDETFDVIAGFEVLEHAYAPIIFLLECNRLLRTGGSLYLRTPGSKYYSLDSWLHHIICPTPRQLLCLLIKAGFQPLQYNDLDISDLLLKENPDLPWLDMVTEDFSISATKLDPLTYERGDLRRYYEVRKTGVFKP